jgi:hypothetical protein
MSHSKVTKRGRSHYVEAWNPRAKKFIVTCSLCGRVGYSPTIMDDGFADTLEKKAIRSELTRIHEPLSLDAEGRCEKCSERANDPPRQT